MISTGELKKGVIIEMDNQLFSILDYQHQKIGRGSAQVRMRLRNQLQHLIAGWPCAGRSCSSPARRKVALA